MTDETPAETTPRLAETRAKRGLGTTYEAPDGLQPDGADVADTAAAQVERKLRNWGVAGTAWRAIKKSSKPDEEWRKQLVAEDAFVVKAGKTQSRYLRGREYTVSALPLFSEERIKAADAKDPETGQGPRDALDAIRLALYGEAMASWRMLTDVRFRLFNMLPAISIVAFVPLLLAATQAWQVRAAGLVLALLGLGLSHGLHIYEQRNDGLYNDLIARARRIEAELGLETGVMLGRLATPHPRVSHGRAAQWIFGCVKAAWLTVAIFLAVSLVVDVDDDNSEPQNVEVVEVDEAPETEAGG